MLQCFTGMQMTENKTTSTYKIKTGRTISPSIPSCIGVGAPRAPGSLVVHIAESIYRKHSSVYGV